MTCFISDPPCSRLSPACAVVGERPAVAAGGDDGVEQRMRQREAAEVHQLLDRRHRGIEHPLPRVRARFDREQVQQHLLIEPPHFELADR